jgi:type VI secretion system secreted protein Hcp
MSMEIAGLGTFEVLAFQWGASNSGTLLSGGGGAGKANIQDLSVTKYTDTFSPALMEAITSGQHFQRATLTFAPQSGKSSLVLEVSPVLVTSLAMGGQSADTRLTENLSLGFARFRYSYGQASTESDITKG